MKATRASKNGRSRGPLKLPGLGLGEAGHLQGSDGEAGISPGGPGSSRPSPTPTASGFMMARVRFMYPSPPFKEWWLRTLVYRCGSGAVLRLAVALRSGPVKELERGFRGKESHQLPPPDHRNLAYPFVDHEVRRLHQALVFGDAHDRPGHDLPGLGGLSVASPSWPRLSRSGTR